MLHRSYRKNSKRLKKPAVELYDLRRDPGETQNIADKHPYITENMKKVALSYYKDLVPPKTGLQSMFIVSIVIPSME